MDCSNRPDGEVLIFKTIPGGRVTEMFKQNNQVLCVEEMDETAAQSATSKRLQSP